MTLKFDNVYTASGVAKSRHDGLCFGDLQDMGYLTKHYRQVSRHDPDGFTIEWTVVGDIEFTDSHGNHWKQGDVIEWEK